MKNSRLKSGVIAAVMMCGAALPQQALAAPPAKAFGELPVGFDAAISPDGKRVATIINSEGIYYVVSRPIDAPKAKPVILRLGENIKPRYVKWVNDDRYVVSVNKSEKYRGTPFTVGYLYSQNVVTDDSGFVVKPKDMFRQYNNVVVDWLEDDPENILMAYSNEEFYPYPNIYRVNVETGRAVRVQRSRQGIERWMTDDDGVPRIGWGQTDRGNKRMIIFDPAKESWDSHEDYPGIDTDTPIFNILKDGTELIIGDYNGRDTLGLYIYDLNQKRVVRELFHNDEYDASGVVVSTDGETVIGAKYVADEVETELLGEYSTLIDRIRAKYPGYAVSYIDQTADYETMIVRMSTSYEPGGLFTFSRGDDDIEMIERRYSGLVADDMGNVVSIKYTARDGQKIPAYVTMPPTIQTQEDFKDLPFIILPHGGPYGRDAKRFDYFAQFFATRGYGVMQMNFRGSEGFGKSFEDAGRDNWLVMQEDVEDATNFLYAKGYADRSRTCIAGWSYGGYAALMGAAKDADDKYKCVVAMAALTDINDAKRDMRRYRGGKYAAKTFFGDAMKDSDVRKANSPVHVAGNIKVPVFLAHGDLDQNVQFDQFTRMKKALKRAGVDGTYMAFEEEDHFLSRQHNREDFFEGVETFLLKVNGPSEFMAK